MCVIIGEIFEAPPLVRGNLGSANENSVNADNYFSSYSDFYSMQMFLLPFFF